MGVRDGSGGLVFDVAGRTFLTVQAVIRELPAFVLDEEQRRCFLNDARLMFASLSCSILPDAFHLGAKRTFLRFLLVFTDGAGFHWALDPCVFTGMLAKC